MRAACDYFDRTGGAGTEIAVLTKIFSSEAAVQVVYDAHAAGRHRELHRHPALRRSAAGCARVPAVDGGNVGMRRPYLQASICGGVCTRAAMATAAGQAAAPVSRAARTPAAELIAPVMMLPTGVRPDQGQAGILSPRRSASLR
jgi:hypothetical protein